ncbi:hypothetical protein niasHT_006457 [Heterodera trifolii]|uniref:Uncharacterized protein n=1 Tax=Heterodera trifolii TaxID=157864 RepID=A0ABD2LWX8_9BILA
MPKSKKIKRSKKTVSAAPSRQMPLAQNYEDLTSSDESAIADKNSPLTPTTNVVVERIFSGDPEMADEGGKRVSRSENGQHIEKMSVNSALGPPVMIENKSGCDNEPNCEESEVRIEVLDKTRESLQRFYSHQFGSDVDVSAIVDDAWIVHQIDPVEEDYRQWCEYLAKQRSTSSHDQDYHHRR